MPKPRKLSIQFPLAGLDRRGSYRQQAPYSTPDAMNVRPFSTLEGRERGGSRPGLDLSHRTDLGSEIRMLECMNISQYDGFRYWTDVFNGTSLAAIWSTASWATSAPTILSSFQSSVSYDTSSAAVVRDAITDLDDTQEYSIDMFISPYDGEHHGTYTIYGRMNNTTPDIETDGIKAELTMTGSDGSFDGLLTVVASGVETEYAFTSGTDGASVAGWFKVLVDGDDISVYWRDNVLIDAQTVSADAGLRVGFGMDCSVAGGICICDTFRVQYYMDTDQPEIKDLLVAAAGGDIYREKFRGELEVVSSNLGVRDVELHGVQRGQKLYIADYGLVESGDDGTTNTTTFDAASVSDWTAIGANKYDYVVVISNGAGGTVDGTYAISSIASGSITLATSAGTGTCSYRVERAPKVYDPVANTLTVLAATVGQVPSGNPLIARFRDRIVLAAADNAPHVWYMSRQAAATDWDYSEEDSQAAVAGTSSPAGVPGHPITCLAPHSDDYLIVGCTNSLWVMKGDPSYGGELDCLSQTVGVVGAGAWTFGPAGEFIFLSQDGIYVVSAGANGYPQPVSREVLPAELININKNSTTVLLEYDARDRGIHIYLTPESSNDRVHWWMDWERKTFWPVQLQGDHEPTAICRLVAQSSEDTGVILGCRDGQLRRYSAMNINDGGTAIDNYVVLGPIPLGNDYQAGKMIELVGVLGDDSGDVTWLLEDGESYEAAVDAIKDATAVGAAIYFVDASGNYFVDASGNYFISGTGAGALSTGTWSEGLNPTVRPAGRGNAFCLKLVGGDNKWTMERITALTTLVGKNRYSA